MPKKREPIKTFMTKQRIQEVKSEVAELERMLKGEDEGDTGYLAHAAAKITDPKEVQREINTRKKMLAGFTPHKLTGAKANRAYAWAKKFEKWFSEYQLSNKDLHQSYPKSNSKAADFEAAVAAQTKIMGNPRIQEAIATYKHIMRRIDPDDTMITNLERLRR